MNVYAWISLVLAILTAAVMVGLLLVKVVRHRRAKKRAFRVAIYIAALGEIVSRSTLPGQDVEKWSADPAFRETLVDFLNFVDGAERQILVDLAQQLGLIEQLHRELTSGRRPLTRLRAAAELAEIAAPESRQYLQQALEDRSVEVRVSAAAGLSLIGDEADVAPVLAALEREDRWAAERMTDALVRFGASAVQVLSNHILIAGPDLEPIPNHLPLAVRALGLIGDPRAEPALLHALTGQDAVLRIKAAAALAHPWGQRSTRALMRRLKDEDWRVRAQAATALAAHGEPQTLPALRLSLRDQAWWVRQNAAHAMAQIPGGIDALFAALGDDDRFAVDTALAQLMASGALQHLDDEKREIIEQLERPDLLDKETG